MREKILEVADKLIERADAYEEPFKNDEDSHAFIKSQSYAIASALRETAYQIRKVLE